MIARDIVTLRAPELATDMDRVDDLIELSKSGLDSKALGSRYQEALALRVMHWLTMEGRHGVGGPVTSETEGSLSRSYGISGMHNLDSTSYGQELKDLIRSTVFAARNRMVP